MKYRVKFLRSQAMWQVQSSRFGILWMGVGPSLWFSIEGAQWAIKELEAGRSYRKANE